METTQAHHPGNQGHLVGAVNRIGYLNPRRVREDPVRGVLSLTAKVYPIHPQHTLKLMLRECALQLRITGYGG